MMEMEVVLPRNEIMYRVCDSVYRHLSSLSSSNAVIASCSLSIFLPLLKNKTMVWRLFRIGHCWEGSWKVPGMSRCYLCSQSSRCDYLWLWFGCNWGLIFVVAPHRQRRCMWSPYVGIVGCCQTGWHGRCYCPLLIGPCGFSDSYYVAESPHLIGELFIPNQSKFGVVMELTEV